MSASNTLPITIEFSSFPPQVRWTPQQQWDAGASRLRLVTSTSFALFVSGSTEPSSNVGPWLRGGTSWYVWSDTLGKYVPQVLAPESLGYWIGPDAPDHNVFSVWIETTAGGSPLAVKTYYSGAWVDVYAATLASYATVTAVNAAIAASLASYSTTTQMNTAISNAIAGIPAAETYPAQGVATAQLILVDTTPYKLAFTSAPVNPAPAPFDTTNRRYIAPADGVYQVSVAGQFDNWSGVAAGMEVKIELYKNGSFVGNGMADEDNTPSPNGSRWSPGFSGIVSLAANDYLEIFATLSDGVNSGNATLTVGQFSISRVSA